MDVAFGEYRLLHKLGEGGAANVYLALRSRPSGFRKLCVVKCLKGALAADPAMRESFMAEAKLSARLSHPNVVQVHEVFEAQGTPAIVMDYLEGRSLSALRRELSLPLPLHVYVLSEALRGLDYFHELEDESGARLNPVHRDVSPHNLFVTYEGEVKVLDFGIAKLAGDPQTEHGIFKGNLSYLAPEQLRLKHADVMDRTTDLFAVGIILWEAIAGHALFRGLDEAEVLVRCLNGEYPKLEAGDTEAPPALVAVANRAMNLDRATRYQSATEMREALQPYLDRFRKEANREHLRSTLKARYETERAAFKRQLSSLLAQTEHTSAASSAELVQDLLSSPPSNPRDSADCGNVAALVPSGRSQRLRPPAGNFTDTERAPAPNRVWRYRLVFGASALLAVLALTALVLQRIGASGPPPEATQSNDQAAIRATAMAPTVPQLAPHQECSRTSLLFDFESGRAESCSTAWRAGGPFVAYFDGTGTIDPQPGILGTSTPLPVSRGSSRSGLHWRTQGQTVWGAGLAVPLHEQKPLDLSRFQGFSIWILANRPTPLRFGLAMPATLDAAYGGTCESRSQARCGDHYSVKRVVSSIWTQVRVDFADLRQEGWGRAVSWEPHRVQELHIDAFRRDAGVGKGEPLSVDIWLDDAELY